MTTTTDYGTWCNRVDRYSVSLAQTVTGVAGSFADHYDLPAAIAAYGRAIDEALPDDVSLCGSDFIGPAYPEDGAFEGYPVNEDGGLDIKAIVEGVDLSEILEQHEIPEDQAVIVSVVDGPSFDTSAVEFGPLGITIPGEVMQWAEENGVRPENPDLYLLAAPLAVANAIPEAVASKTFRFPEADVAAIRAAL